MDCCFVFKDEYYDTITCTACKPVLGFPTPSTVVTARPCIAHSGYTHAFTE